MATKLPEAAAELHVRPDTLRAWLRNGAPCVRPGRSGPGGAALVDVAAIRAWRGRGGADAPLVQLDVATLARGLAAAFRACGDLGITARQRAMLLALAYQQVVIAVTGHPPAEPHPPETRWLIAVALGSAKVKP